MRPLQQVVEGGQGPLKMRQIAASLLGEAKSQGLELRDRETILAYLEELARLGSAVQVWVGKECLLPYEVRIKLVEEGQKRFLASLGRALPHDVERQHIEISFPLDGRRFIARVKCLGREGYMTAAFSIPESVEEGERRQRVRARFGPREKARVTILGDLFDGYGVAGRIMDLSLHGIKIRVDRTIQVRGARVVPNSANVFAMGESLALVRLQDLPHTSQVECSGRVAHIEQSSLGVTIGVKLDGLSLADQARIEATLIRRLPTFARSFPNRKRRKDGELKYDRRPGDAVESLGPDEVWEDPSEYEGGEGLLPDDSNPLPLSPLSVSEEWRRERLRRIKKHGKRIMVISLDDFERAILAGTLHVDGFRRIVEARNFVEGISALRSGPVDLVFMDFSVGNLQGPALLAKLRQNGLAPEIPVIFLSDSMDVRSLIIAKGSGAHLHARPVDFDGMIRPLIHQLLEIA